MVNAASADDGTTALMNAAMHGNDKIVQLLLSRGANKDTKDTWNRTALQLATTFDTKQLLA